MWNYKTLVRDALISKAGIKSLFGASASGSCWINMENIRTTARYPQILIGYGAGETVPGMDADEARIYLTVECTGTAEAGGTGIHALKQLGKFRSEILTAIDDMSLTATSYCYHIRKFSETEGFDNDKKVYWLRMGFDFLGRQNLDLP